MKPNEDSTLVPTRGQITNNPPASPADVHAILVVMRALERRLGRKALRGMDQGVILGAVVLEDRRGADRTLSQMVNAGLVRRGNRSAYYGPQWRLTDKGRTVGTGKGEHEQDVAESAS